MIKLTNSILLEGFDDIEPAHLIVVKKMVGIFAKKILEEKGDFDRFEVKKEDSKISINLKINNKSFENQASGDNLFCSFGNAVNGLIDKL